MNERKVLNSVTINGQNTAEGQIGTASTARQRHATTCCTALPTSDMGGASQQISPYHSNESIYNPGYPVDRTSNEIGESLCLHHWQNSLL